MKASKNVLIQLNKILTFELTSINQYFLHARMCKNWGLENLNSHAYKKSIKDMKQSDVLIERILMLGGLPNLQQLNKLFIGETPEETLACDMKLQLQQVELMKEAIAVCEAEKDYVSRALLSDILTYEEEYVDWLETQHEQLSMLGVQNYLQSQTAN